jgi:hypothetical protein
MIGSLVKFSCERRCYHFPTTPQYPAFDGKVGLVTSYTKKEDSGDESVRVQWVQPFFWANHDFPVKESDFNLLNFEIVGRV